MLGVDHDKSILLFTPFPTIPMLGKNCVCDVGLIVLMKINDVVLYFILLYSIV